MKATFLSLLAVVLVAAVVFRNAAAQTPGCVHPLQDQPTLQSGAVKAHEGSALQGRMRPGVFENSRKRIAAPARIVGLLSAGVIRRVPQQYSTIQAAINAAADGDTVLVSEGMYKENIRYRGKAIVVASLYLIDNDTTHIGKTIIDGSSSTHADSGSVVYFISGEDTTSVLCGLTIQGGTGTNWSDSLGTVQGREGGGVLCKGAGARLVRNVITRNRVIARVAEGGGVIAYGRNAPWIIMDGNHITDNYVGSDTDSTFGSSGGASIVDRKARLVGNVFERDTTVGSFVWGTLAFYSSSGGSPFPEASFVGNVFRSNVAKATQEGAIGAGLVLLWTGDVTVQNNLFESNTVTSMGAGGWAWGSGMVVNDESSTGYGRKMIMNNRFLNNTVAGKGFSAGGGLFLMRTLATVSRNYFADNVVAEVNPGAGGGAGISLWFSSFRVENSIFTRNSSAVGAGGLDVNRLPQVGVEQVIINNTVVSNFGKNVGGLAAVNASNLVLLNNIFWNDSSLYGDPEIGVGGSIAGIAYCDVYYGYPGTGNIDADPGFIVGDPKFKLMASSPCIGRGIDSIEIKGIWYHAPTHDFDGMSRPMPSGTRPDIGAQEERTVVVGISGREELPVSYDLHQNYPNPFNPSTTIKYDLPKSSVVRLTVYDMLGREVSMLVNERKEMGVYEVKFDGSRLSSGVYFYQIQAGSFVETRKLLLVR